MIIYPQRVCRKVGDVIPLSYDKPYMALMPFRQPLKVSPLTITTMTTKKGRKSWKLIDNNYNRIEDVYGMFIDIQWMKKAP